MHPDDKVRSSPQVRAEAGAFGSVVEAQGRESPLALKLAPSKSLDINAVCGSLTAGSEGNARQLLHQTTSMKLRTHADNDEQPAGSWPMPKWPVHHQSAAFEAVAFKKSLILSPAEIYAECAHHGEEKAKFGWLKFTLLSIIAGCYVSFGFTLCLLVGGNMPKEWLHDSPGLFSLAFGVFGFPFGFTTIIVCGGELFTSMCAYTAAAWWERKITLKDAIRMCLVSWFGNWAGISIFLGFMIAAGNFEGSKNWYSVYLAEHKVHYGWGRVFVKGIFANWLVGIATWMANAAQDLTGKAVAIWLPISAFAAIGFEHCIANQYLIPLAIYYGADINARDFVAYNLIPSSLGNWVGGAIMVASVYAFIYGTPAKELNAWWDRRAAAAQAQAAQAHANPQYPLHTPHKP